MAVVGAVVVIVAVSGGKMLEGIRLAKALLWGHLTKSWHRPAHSDSLSILALS